MGSDAAFAASHQFSDSLVGCIPCRPRTKVGHPTDCHKYFHCTAAKSWRQLSCPASTYYNEATKLCIDPRTTNGSVCLYEQGINVNQYRDVEYLPVCRNAIPPTTASPSTTVTGGVPVKPTDRQSGDYFDPESSNERVRPTSVVSLLGVKLECYRGDERLCCHKTRWLNLVHYPIHAQACCCEHTARSVTLVVLCQYLHHRALTYISTD